MENGSRINIEKFNGQNLEFLKLKMKYILVDREKWVVVSLERIMMGMSREEWEKIERREMSRIRLRLEHLVLLSDSGEDSTKKLWDTLRILY